MVAEAGFEANAVSPVSSRSLAEHALYQPSVWRGTHRVQKLLCKVRHRKLDVGDARRSLLTRVECDKAASPCSFNERCQPLIDVSLPTTHGNPSCRMLFHHCVANPHESSSVCLGRSHLPDRCRRALTL
jgi:hypothetical protein